MEPLFINNFTHSKEMYIEMNKAYSFVSRLIFQIAVAVIYGFLAVLLFFYYGNYFSGAAIVLVGVFLFFYPLINTRIHAKKREKQLAELFGELPSAQNLFFDDHLLAISSADKSELKIEYDKIIKVRQSKNLYLLIMKQKLVIMVDKNRFEKGSCEEFEQFIKSKAVNAKIKL